MVVADFTCGVELSGPYRFANLLYSTVLIQYSQHVSLLTRLLRQLRKRGTFT
jgi:trans-aconitate methyltransferase